MQSCIGLKNRYAIVPDNCRETSVHSRYQLEIEKLLYRPLKNERNAWMKLPAVSYNQKKERLNGWCDFNKWIFCNDLLEQKKKKKENSNNNKKQTCWHRRMWMCMHALIDSTEFCLEYIYESTRLSLHKQQLASCILRTSRAVCSNTFCLFSNGQPCAIWHNSALTKSGLSELT